MCIFFHFGEITPIFRKKYAVTLRELCAKLCRDPLDCWVLPLTLLRYTVRYKRKVSEDNPVELQSKISENSVMSYQYAYVSVHQCFIVSGYIVVYCSVNLVLRSPT